MNFWRGISTVMIWIVVGTAVTLSIVNGTYTGGWAAVAIAGLSLIVGLIATIGIWVLPALIESQRPAPLTQAHETPGKAKRGGGNPGMTETLHALMSVMDDEERAEFKEKLVRVVLDQAAISTDGELGGRMSLADLLGEEEENLSGKRLRR